MHKVNT